MKSGPTPKTNDMMVVFPPQSGQLEETQPDIGLAKTWPLNRQFPRPRTVVLLTLLTLGGLLSCQEKEAREDSGQSDPAVECLIANERLSRVYRAFIDRGLVGSGLTHVNELVSTLSLVSSQQWTALELSEVEKVVLENRDLLADDKDTTTHMDVAFVPSYNLEGRKANTDCLSFVTQCNLLLMLDAAWHSHEGDQHGSVEALLAGVRLGTATQKVPFWTRKVHVC